MERCGDKDCLALCDFCAHFDDKEHHCRKHDEVRYPTDGCTDFKCMYIDKPKAQFAARAVKE